MMVKNFKYPRHIFRANWAVILVVAFMGMGNSAHAQQPVAGFTIDSTAVPFWIAVGDIMVYVTNTSTGSPSAIQYVFHVPGTFLNQYGSTSTTVPNPQLILTHPLPIVCGPFALTQIVTNNFGSDTMTVNFSTGCPCLTIQPTYTVNFNVFPYGLVEALAQSDENSVGREILWPGCPAFSTICVINLPGPGTYNVCGYYDYGTCTPLGVTHCDSVTVSCAGPPTVSFFATNVLNTVSFNNQSQSWPSATYAWDFGDGNIDTMQSPNHTYLQAGVYYTCLTVTDTCGQATYCDSVEVLCSPLVSFFQTINNLQVSFTGQVSSAGPTTYAWDFGDGNNSTQVFPTHTYSFPGTYLVCLNATNVCGTTTFCDTIVTSCAAPQVSFSSNAMNFQVNFAGMVSGNGNTSYIWDFGDGNSGNGLNASHTYASTGAYLVCLTVTDTCGQSSHCDSVQVTFCPSPTATFSYSAVQLLVNFNSQALGTGFSSYAWTFGDGNASSQQNPAHSYSIPGSYPVCLTFADSCGTIYVCDTVAVTCSAPSVSYSFQQNQFQVDFTGATSGQGPFTYAWDFGDGNSSTQQNPSHSYAANGNYLVCFTAADGCGVATICDTVVIAVVGNEEALAMAFSVYPNPVNGKLVLDFGRQSLAEGKIEMYDMRGKLVLLESVGISQSIVRLDVSDVAEGLYLVKYESKDLRIFSKVLIQR